MDLQLQTITKDNSSIEDYILKINSIADHLADAGEIVSDQDLILCATRGVDPRYLPFISSLSMRADSLSFHEFQNLLQSHNRMLDHQSPFFYASHLMQFNVAAMTFRGPSSSNLARKLANPTQNIHDFLSQKAQKSSIAPLSGDFNHSKHPTSSPNPKIQCQICHKPGHFADRCFKLCDILACKFVGPSAFT